MSDSGGNAEKAAENEQPDGGKSPNSEGFISVDGDDDTPNPFSGKRKSVQRKKKSKKRKVETSSSDSSSDNSEMSDESSSVSDSGSQSEDPGKTRSKESNDKEQHHVRFHVRESRKPDLLLPPDMKDYLKECFTEFTPDKVLREKILDQYPPPTFTKSMELDDYVADIFSGLNTNYGKPYDDNLSTIQGRIGKAMGQLGRIWLDFENIRKGASSDNSLDIYECLEKVEKSITLLGQAFITTVYHRRMNILYNLTKDLKRAKHLLKKNNKRLSKHKNLFGKRFYKSLSKEAKVSKSQRR